MTQTKVFREPSGKKFLGHPVGLYLLFMTELWERFSYYGMRAILVLYLTGSFISGGLGFEESYAYLLYGWFTGLVYFTPLIGGWIADKYLGHRKAITIGGLTMFIGQMVLFLFASKTGLYAGLMLLIIGNGFFKPNISVLVGGLYKQGDPKRDSAFSIFYMGINIGAFFAPLIVGLFVNNWFGTIDPETNMVVKYAYNYGFLAAALGMLIGQIFFNTLSNKYLGDLGVEPEGDRKEKELVSQFKQGVKEKVPLTKAEKQRTIAIFVYFFFAIFFFAGFEQAGSSFTLFTKNYIDRFIGGFEIPTEWFQSINPLFIVLLTPIFATFWPSKTGQKITTPIKMGTGIVLLGLGFLFMVLASSKVDTTTGATVVKISMWWMVITYLMHTIGELCLSPVGLSTVTKLSPPKLASLLMGVWLLSSFFGNIVAGQIASATSSLGLTHVYEVLAIGAIVFGIALICLNKVLLKMMNGVR